MKQTDSKNKTLNNKDHWGIETQPCFEALGDLWVKIVENAVINIELVRLSPQEWPKVGHGTAK